MSDSISHPIYDAALNIKEELVQWRRHIHRNPEPSMQEHETAAYVAEHLREFGLSEVQTGVGETGVVGLIRGEGDATVALRADMDALELPEENDVPYASENPGVMHACGHDGHTTCLLGAAAILANHGSLPGNVKLIFQPGEEGHAGARKMIRDGCLRDPDVGAIAGLHLTNEVPSGYVGIRHGYWTAQSDSIDMTVHGQTGHASRPDQGVDSVAVTAQLLQTIQEFIGRHTSALDRKLVTFGSIQGGTRRNILAGSVALEGTIRTLEPRGREAVLDFIQNRLPTIAEAMGAELEVHIDEGYPPLHNDENVVNTMDAAARDLYGDDPVVDVPQPVLGAEDFAFYATEGNIPAAMCRLGTLDEEKGFTGALHSTTFDFDDEHVLPIGAALMANIALHMLKGDYLRS